MANPTALDIVETDIGGAVQATQYCDLNGAVVVTTRQALVADAVVAHDVNATFSDTEVEATLDALGVKINAILDVLENHGLMASS